MSERPKSINFRGQDIPVDVARSMLAELRAALGTADPVETKDPTPEESSVVLSNPMWITAPSLERNGVLLHLRDSALGWRSYCFGEEECAHMANGLVYELLQLKVKQDSLSPKAAPVVKQRTSKRFVQ